jgi:hypothetical protein
MQATAAAPPAGLFDQAGSNNLFHQAPPPPRPVFSKLGLTSFLHRLHRCLELQDVA